LALKYKYSYLIIRFIDRIPEAPVRRDRHAGSG